MWISRENGHQVCVSSQYMWISLENGHLVCVSSQYMWISWENGHLVCVSSQYMWISRENGHLVCVSRQYMWISWEKGSPVICVGLVCCERPLPCQVTDQYIVLSYGCDFLNFLDGKVSKPIGYTRFTVAICILSTSNRIPTRGQYQKR